MAYLSRSEAEVQEMLREIGVERFEDLIDYIPAENRFRGTLNLPEPLSELEIHREIERLTARNRLGAIFLGGGAYDHYIPAAVKHILLRPEFYTAYTPYQAEVSQGTLQAIYEYQTMICRLTGMEVANASMYDGGSALAEAVLMAAHHTRKNRVLLPENINPLYRRIVETYVKDQQIELVSVPVREGVVERQALLDLLDDATAAVVVQNPNFYGLIENPEGLAEAIHEKRALFIMSVDPISLALLKTPGEWGADIVVGEGQALGNPLNLGGPYLGIFAARKALIRKMPGRIVAMTTDVEGKTAFVTTLQTREQHIRREKATSNICTNSQLCALAALVYLSLMGERGLRRVAELSLQKSHYLAEQIAQLPGFELKYRAPFFKEFVVSTPVPPGEIIQKLMEKNIFAGIDLQSFNMGQGLLVAVTEKRSREELDHYVQALKDL